MRVFIRRHRDLPFGSAELRVLVADDGEKLVHGDDAARFLGAQLGRPAMLCFAHVRERLSDGRPPGWLVRWADTTVSEHRKAGALFEGCEDGDEALLTRSGIKRLFSAFELFDDFSFDKWFHRELLPALQRSRPSERRNRYRSPGEP